MQKRIGNPLLFFEDITTRSKSKKHLDNGPKHLNYTGEISNFLFTLGLLSGIGALVQSQLDYFPQWYTLMIIFFISGMVSFYDWSVSMLGFVSVVCGTIEKIFKNGFGWIQWLLKRK